MDSLVLKEQLNSHIEGQKVVAAIFHTFNFDPRFFENYVMPLLVVTEHPFREEEIYNKILWRHCAKENLIPPIAVYCDYFAKSNTVAPSLGYDIHCIKMPATKNYFSSFHPKQLFILLENRTLLMVTGSGNLTANGWCDNMECFAIEKIEANKSRPNSVTTNFLQDYLNQVHELVSHPASSKKALQSTAHQKIHNFLNYVDLSIPFFNSFTHSFSTFLEEQIPIDTIDTVEIISPYYSNNTQNIAWFREKGIQEIHCLIPTLKSNEVLLKKETFQLFHTFGVHWSLWKDQSLNEQVRNLHAKIYRLHSKTESYTIIGSVNCTNPAWQLFDKKNNGANIESAWLYASDQPLERLLKTKKNLNLDALIFIEKEALENHTMGENFSRNPPNLAFILDWKHQVLEVKAKLSNEHCQFVQSCQEQSIRKGSYKIPLKKEDIRRFSKQSLIKIKVIRKETIEYYTYYANQRHIEQKPLGFKISAYTILTYWRFFEDESHNKRLTEALAQLVTNESGFIDESKIETKLLFNEMATHFSALVRLEQYVFEQDFTSQKNAQRCFKKLRYYLLNENVDTLPFYLDDLEEQFEGKKIQKSFLWMILQIVDINFYSNALKWKGKSKIESKTWRIFKKDIQLKQKKLLRRVALLTNDIRGLEEKNNWVRQQLKQSYD